MKSEAEAADAESWESPPFAGVRIEIDSRNAPCKDCPDVTPFTGVGIEIVFLFQGLSTAVVTPLAGVGIEITSDQHPDRKYGCHPPRGGEN